MSSRGNLRRVQNRQYTTNRLTEVQTALSTLSQSGPRTLQILKTGHSLLTECLTLRSWEIVIDRVLYPPIHDDGALSSRAFHGDLEHILTVLGHLKEMVEEYPDVKGGEGETGEKGKKGSVYEYVTGVSCVMPGKSEVLRFCGSGKVAGKVEFIRRMVKTIREKYEQGEEGTGAGKEELVQEDHDQEGKGGGKRKKEKKEKKEGKSKRQRSAK